MSVVEEGDYGYYDDDTYISDEEDENNEEGIPVAIVYLGKPFAPGVK